MRRTLTLLLCASALLLGAVACSDDSDTSSSDTTTPEGGGPTTLASGQDVELVGEGLGSQTLDIAAEESEGEVTGEVRVSDVVVVSVECADTDTDGVVILGGEVTVGDPTHVAVAGELLALIISEGDPDRVALYPNSSGAGSCTELLESIPEDPLADESGFADVAAGSDIQTG